MTRPDELETILDQAGLVGAVGHTLVMVTGTTAELVVAALGASTVPVPPERINWDDGSAYSVVPVAGGVLALEQSGFADPAETIVAQLAHNGSAAVVRGGGEANERIACARDGVIVWDAGDWDMIEAESRSEVPAELRPLFDTAWADPDGDGEDDPEVDVFATAVAMAEIFTGVTVTHDDLARLVEADVWYPVAFSF